MDGGGTRWMVVEPNERCWYQMNGVVTRWMVLVPNEWCTNQMDGAGTSYRRPAGLLDPEQGLSSISFVFSLIPVKVLSSEGTSAAGKQRRGACPRCGNLLYLPMPLRHGSPASHVTPGNGIFGISCFKAGVYFSCSEEC